MSLLRPDEKEQPLDAPLPRKHPLRHRVAVGFTVVLAVLVVIVGAGVAYAAIQNGRLQKLTSLNKKRGDLDAAISKVPKGEPVNILVVGNDSRAFAKNAKEKRQFGARDVGESQRSDTMMVMRLDPKNDRASILSIARDLWVDLEGGGKGRINEAFGSKGDSTKADPDRLIRTIRTNFGITINHYIEIDFAGFRQVVDAIGGVNVYFPYPARDEKSGLKVDDTGCVKLDGRQALSYVRSRNYEFRDQKGWHIDGSGDIGRIQRQQDFIKRVVRKAVAEGLTNPVRAARLIEAGIDNVKVDGSFGVNEMKRLASQLRDLDDSKVAFAALTGEPDKVGDADVLRLNPARANEILAPFGAKVPGPSTTARRGSPAPTGVPASTSIVLYNGSNRDGLVAEVQGELQRLGLRATSGGNGQVATTTQVRHRSGNEDAARAVQAYIGGEVELVPDRTVKNGEIVVLLGKSFTGIVAPGSNGKTSTATTAAPAAAPTTAPPRGSDPSHTC